MVPRHSSDTRRPVLPRSLYRIFRGPSYIGRGVFRERSLAQGQRNLRRCPWCWEMIERWAVVCEHCQKEVSPLEEAPPVAPALEPEPAGSQPGEKAARASTASSSVVAAPLPDNVVQIARWVTAVLIFAVLLFGVSLLLPSPNGLVIGVLTLGEVAAAYVINQFLWRRLTNHPTINALAWVVGALSVLTIAFMVLRQLGMVLGT